MTRNSIDYFLEFISKQTCSKKIEVICIPEDFLYLQRYSRIYKVILYALVQPEKHKSPNERETGQEDDTIRIQGLFLLVSDR